MKKIRVRIQTADNCFDDYISVYNGMSGILTNDKCFFRASDIVCIRLDKKSLQKLKKINARETVVWTDTPLIPVKHLQFNILKI